MLLTSGYNFEGYVIKEYLGFCSGECALGTGFLSSFSAGLADILGSNSSLYEEKLSKAKSMAISELESKALEYGANAIIGVDVDYTTFSADIMGVAANGTAVKVEKISGYENADQDNEIFRTFPVISYYNTLKFRPINCNYNTKTKEFDIEIFLYNSVELEAMNVDIIANTIFNTTYEYKDINFVGCNEKNGTTKTEKVLLDICDNSLKVIKSFSVKINHCIFSSKIHTINEQYQVSGMNIDDLLEYRKSYGKDIMEDFGRENESWVCLCGNKNNEDSNVCSYCSRENKVYRKIKTSWEAVLKKIYPELSAFRNCKEINEYMGKVEEEYNVIFPEELMQELKKILLTERMYGSMADTAIAKIRVYLD